MFCDTNTPKYDGKFTVYEDIKQKLIESGQYKPEEIAFVHDAKNDKQRIEMFEKLNKAKIRLIIGSTGKLGTGVNIQRNLIAMHHTVRLMLNIPSGTKDDQLDYKLKKPLGNSTEMWIIREVFYLMDCKDSVKLMLATLSIISLKYKLQLFNEKPKFIPAGKNPKRNL